MQHKNFIAFIAARSAISLAGSMLSVAIGWHIYQLTGNPFDLALVGLVQITPILALFMLSGWVVDHFSRRSILMLSVGADTLLVIGMAMVLSADVFNKPALFGLLFLHGCVRAFYRPAQEAVLPNIVDADFFPRAVAVSSVTFNIASTSGPFVAGLLLAVLDYQVYWLLAVLTLAATLLFGRLPSLMHVRPTGSTREVLLAGIRFIRASPIVLGCLSLDLLAVLFGSVIALLPVYAADILHVGPEALGLLRGMPALGAVTVGLVLTRAPVMRSSGKLLFGALLLFALSILVFAFSTNFWLSLAALWLYGGSDTISVNIRSTLIQLATPNELRGRVSAVNTIFIATSNQLGEFRAGSVAALASPVFAVALGGAMALGVALGGYFLFPKIRNLDRVADAGR
ncbi:MAG: MFS transporter [Gammaproteobacteria bacterium]|nr:MFS transporter [Gammaproteobacteria bacterium]MDH5304637.1 MFS transporter [Gammaproteobacteria bacterium]MDH5322506.1 MFS transporter [Gammaproteobacteria bacterium]